MSKKDQFNAGTGTHRTDERQHVAGDVASREALACVGEEVFPLAFEYRVL